MRSLTIHESFESQKVKKSHIRSLLEKFHNQYCHIEQADLVMHEKNVPILNILAIFPNELDFGWASWHHWMVLDFEAIDTKNDPKWDFLTFWDSKPSEFVNDIIRNYILEIVNPIWLLLGQNWQFTQPFWVFYKCTWIRGSILR